MHVEEGLMYVFYARCICTAQTLKADNVVCSGVIGQDNLSTTLASPFFSFSLIKLAMSSAEASERFWRCKQKLRIPNREKQLLNCECFRLSGDRVS